MLLFYIMRKVSPTYIVKYRNYYANQKKRRTSKIDDKTFPRNEKQKTKRPFESSWKELSSGRNPVVLAQFV